MTVRKNRSTGRRILRVALVIAGGLAAVMAMIGLSFVVVVPSPIDAAEWNPPARPELRGPLAENNELEGTSLIAAGRISGPEDIIFDEQGRLYTGGEDGVIYRVTLDQGENEHIEEFASTEGRPLGLRFDGQGNLIVADSERGLLSVSPNGEVTVLTDSVDGTPITYADELDVARNGTIYFSDTSTKFERGFPYDMLESCPHRRLLSYNPRTRSTEVLADELYFANGVSLTPGGRLCARRRVLLIPDHTPLA